VRRPGCAKWWPSHAVWEVRGDFVPRPHSGPRPPWRASSACYSGAAWGLLPWRRGPGQGQRRFKIQDLSPDPALGIELPASMQLSPAERALLQTLFRGYGRLMIEREFQSGYSGARALLALPIRPDGRADAYTIAKIGARPAVEQEYANYEAFVKDTLPPVTARIQHTPVQHPLCRHPGIGGSALHFHRRARKAAAQPAPGAA